MKRCNLCGIPVFRLYHGPLGERCLRCFSTFVHRATGIVVNDLNLPASAAVYELSSHGAWFNYLRRRFRNATFSEFFEHLAPGDFRNGVQCQDVQHLTYPDETFDLVTCTEVFEHVADDRRGFAEVYRVLRRSGWFVFTVPLQLDALTTERAYVRDGQIQHILPPEYHWAYKPFWPLLGRMKVLAFRNYGLDIRQRLESAGFQVEIRVIDDPKHAIRDARVIVCNKLDREHLLTETIQHCDKLTQQSKRKA